MYTCICMTVLYVMGYNIYIYVVFPTKWYLEEVAIEWMILEVAIAVCTKFYL